MVGWSFCFLVTVFFSSPSCIWLFGFSGWWLRDLTLPSPLFFLLLLRKGVHGYGIYGIWYTIAFFLKSREGIYDCNEQVISTFATFFLRFLFESVGMEGGDVFIEVGWSVSVLFFFPVGICLSCVVP